LAQFFPNQKLVEYEIGRELSIGLKLRELLIVEKACSREACQRWR
jgi:hypothetical protein